MAKVNTLSSIQLFDTVAWMTWNSSSL